LKAIFPAMSQIINVGLEVDFSGIVEVEWNLASKDIGRASHTPL
jgi:hypothetical protein